MRIQGGGEARLTVSIAVLMKKLQLKSKGQKTVLVKDKMQLASCLVIMKVQ